MKYPLSSLFQDGLLGLKHWFVSQDPNTLFLLEIKQEGVGVSEERILLSSVAEEIEAFGWEVSEWRTTENGFDVFFAGTDYWFSFTKQEAAAYAEYQKWVKTYQNRIGTLKLECFDILKYKTDSFTSAEFRVKDLIAGFNRHIRVDPLSLESFQTLSNGNAYFSVSYDEYAECLVHIRLSPEGTHIELTDDFGNPLYLNRE